MTMRAALRQPIPPPDLAYASAALPLLVQSGARVVLGGAADALAAPIAPEADTLFGPRGVCLAAPDGPLFVCDTGHHRLLIWHRAPCSDRAAADHLIGQPDFRHEGRNGRREAGAATLNVPAGVAAAGNVLAVADAWNHRVLLWFGYPRRDNQPADVVLGQADFAASLANRGQPAPAADTLHWPYGVALIAGGLYVADTGNRRVLIWDKVPGRSGAPADLVLGQVDFHTRDEDAGGRSGALGMRWPHAVAEVAGWLCVADAGSSRIMLWPTLRPAAGMPCGAVLGQLDFAGRDHNRGRYAPSAASLNMPYGVCAGDGRLIVADTANSRLLGFPVEPTAIGGHAVALAGQEEFAAKGDNRWQPVARNSVCWPYGAAAAGSTLAVADSGNNRVLLWDAA